MARRAGEPLILAALRQGMRLLAKQFVMGRTIEEALARTRTASARRWRYSFDMLGEAARTRSDAARYMSAYRDAIGATGRVGGGPESGPGISVKLSALHPRYEPLQAARCGPELIASLTALAKAAKYADIGLTVDAEEADRLEIGMDIFAATLADRELSGWDGLGLAVQAYQKRALPLVNWVAELARRTGHRVPVRLVKGAYWDTEIKHAQIQGHEDYPVFTRKPATDVSWIACALRMLERRDVLRPAFATHNAHSLSVILEAAGDTDFEMQRLHGMGEALYDGATSRGEPWPLRVYAPVGSHEDLLAYLVRRLLENGANTSFVHRLVDPGVPEDEIVADPVTRLRALGAGPAPRIPRPEALYPDRRNSAGLDLADRARAPSVLDAVRATLIPRAVGTIPIPRAGGVAPTPHADDATSIPRAVGAIPIPRAGGVAPTPNTDGVAPTPNTDGVAPTPRADDATSIPRTAGAAQIPRLVTGTGNVREIRDPADRRRLIGTAADATPAEIETGLTRLARGWRQWDESGGLERAAVLDRAANLIEAARPELLFLLAREAGRTLADGVAEVREAADFCRWYAILARQHFAAPRELPGPTGERNTWSLGGRGIFACISPWNFPLSIFVGQVAAALAAGNVVAAKPAEQTPLIAARAVELLLQAGVPSDALVLLPGDGRTGAALIGDPRIAGVAFTGGTDTARVIALDLAARRGPIVPFIAETGGINAMIVDSSALPEQVVTDVLVSAFGSAGQRCSSLRLLCVQEDVADRILTMLRGAAETLVLGDPLDPATDIGPVIDADAQAALEDYANAMGPPLFALEPPADAGHGAFFAPRAFMLPNAAALKREVFGPVLHVVRYAGHRLDAVLDEIAGNGFGLTLGIHSRIEAVQRHIAARLRVGNAYVNRNQIGAVVGLQPFGGRGLSGTGPKAGGPISLFRYAEERVVSVNTAAAGGNAALLSEDRP
jgi:RHH-type proline utilization regulon transcriptional repressor/proline dehydrogenase/delta 1-pyrroline-5-carboxylate dehydrogenase